VLSVELPRAILIASVIAPWEMSTPVPDGSD